LPSLLFAAEVAMLSRSSRTQCAAIAVAAAALAAALAAAGCTTSHQAASSKPSSRTQNGSAASAGSSLTAAKAVQLAAQRAQRVTSWAATMTVQTSGTTAVSLSGTAHERLQPSLLADINYSRFSLQGQTMPGAIEEIISSSAIYLRMPSLSRMAGKPWVKVPLSEISQATGIDLSQLFQQVESNNPLVKTQMLASSTNVRKVGTATFDGVQTTEYTGSYPLSAGLARLPASFRAQVAPQLQAMGLTTQTFKLWLDDQQQVRKLITSDQGTKEQVSSTFQVTSINQPVTITLPPASQTATVPASALRG
jgi:hypothetical protein